MAKREFMLFVRGIDDSYSDTDDPGSTLSFLLSNLEANGCRLLDARFSGDGRVEENWLDPKGARATYDATYNK